MSRTVLHTWTIYQSPSDFPGLFVARRFDNEAATADHYSNVDIESVRNWILDQAVSYQQGLPHRIPRSPEDDPVIVETWL